MIVLDTTILMHAVGDDHSLRTPSRSVLELIGQRRVRATTTVEVIQEFAHVRNRRRARTDATERARRYRELLRPLVRPDEDDLLQGLHLFEQIPALGSFDSVLAAAARTRELPLASADRAFGEVEGLRYLDPASATFLEDLERVG